MHEPIKILLNEDNNLRNLIMQAPVAMAFLRGKEHVFELVNDIGLLLLGTTWDKIQGLPIMIAMPEFSKNGLDLKLDEVFETGLTFSAVERPLNFTRFGKLDTIYVNFTFQALRNELDEVIGVVTIGVDVTAHVAGRKKLLESELKYKGLFHSMSQGFCIIQMVFDNNEKPVDYIYLEVNPAFETLTGLNNVIGKGAREIIPGHEEHWFEIYGKVALTGEEITTSANSSFLDKWYEVHAFPVSVDDRNTLAVLFTDISERKKTEQEQKRFADALSAMVDQRTRELQRSNEDLEQFAHVVSHDLKEPVRKLATYSHLLTTTNDLTPASSELFLQKIRNSSIRLQDTIEQILKFSSLNQTFENLIEEIDLNDVMTDILSDLEFVINEKDAAIDIARLPVMKGSKILIYQLFYNLISNSLKFSLPSARPYISITYKHHSKGETEIAGITVSDNGIGFDQHFSKKIFNAFVRLNSKDDFSGTGLGLTLCKKIVYRHSGKILARGKVNEGSSFTVLLPLGIKKLCF